jgi:hypothetical protein
MVKGSTSAKPKQKATTERKPATTKKKPSTAVAKGKKKSKVVDDAIELTESEDEEKDVIDVEYVGFSSQSGYYEA